MVYLLSVVAALTLVGYCFARIKARRGEKRSVQTLFNTEQVKSAPVVEGGKS